MLETTLTHYWPWNEPDDVAWCGAPMRDEGTHSPTPSCAACQRQIAIQEALDARLATEAVIALTDDDARYAGVAVAVTPQGQDRCTHCQALSPVYAPFATCTDCTAPTCPACDVPARRTEDERHATQCRACARVATASSDLFAYAVALTRSYAVVAQARGGRR